MPLSIDFVTPECFGFSRSAMNDNNIPLIVCGHVSAFNGLIKHTEMAHIFKRTEDGLYMISRFWLGKTMKSKFNVYAETREQCEAILAEMIAEKKAEIAEEKAKLKEGAD